MFAFHWENTDSKLNNLQDKSLTIIIPLFVYLIFLVHESEVIFKRHHVLVCPPFFSITFSDNYSPMKDKYTIIYVRSSCFPTTFQFIDESE